MISRIDWTLLTPLLYNNRCEDDKQTQLMHADTYMLGQTAIYDKHMSVKNDYRH